MTDLTDFLLARIAEDEVSAQAATPGPWRWEEPSGEAWPTADQSLVSDGKMIEDGYAPYSAYVLMGWGYDASGIEATDQDRAHIARHDPARVLAQCAAYRRIVELHANWPVLVKRPIEFDPAFGAERSLPDQVAMRVSQQIAWLTQEEYRTRFGDEPPTAPMLRALASVYADHPDFDTAWELT